MKKEHVIIAILAIVLIATTAYIVYDKTVTNEPKIELLEQYNNLELYGFTIGLSENDELIINSENYDDYVAVKNIKDTVSIHVGQSDICWSNNWLVLKTNDGKFKALSVDELACGSTIKVIDLELSDVNEIYEQKNITNEYEPAVYTVFARYSDGSTKNITSLFEN